MQPDRPMDPVSRRTPLLVRGVSFDPPLFCAPMAGITHSAFRRLLGDFGGLGGVFSEMLAVKMVIHENALTSPWLKRRPGDGKIIYQFFVANTRHLAAALERLAPVSQDGLDINLGCPAATIQQQGGGSNLFDDPPRLREIIREIRLRYNGPLLVKIRLGRPTPDWRNALRDRLKLFEDEGVDALTLHPRFAEESLNRFPARHAFQAELAAETRLPIIANGDITGPGYALERATEFNTAAGLMVGRMAAARPWIFAQWDNPGFTVEWQEVWNRFCNYLEEDFTPAKALLKLRVFTPYFARNFVFGHTFFSAVTSATEWSSARDRANRFLESAPPAVREISLSGL